MELIKEHLAEIKRLCKKFNVVEMYLFGSALTDHFSSESDIDLLVQFSDVNPFEYYDNFMDFKEEMEQLLSRNVDLIEAQTLKNPILIRSINRNKKVLYGREDSKMAV